MASPPEPKNPFVILAELRQEIQRFLHEQLALAETHRPGYNGEGAKPDEAECRYHEGQAEGARHCDDFLRAQMDAAIKQFERAVFGGGPYVVEDPTATEQNAASETSR